MVDTLSDPDYMLPTLLQLGPIKISSLGFFMVVSLLVIVFLTWREGRKEYLDEEKVMDILLLSVLAGVIGARLFYVILHWDLFGFNILRVFLPTWVPGFYIYGGILTALSVSYLICVRKKINFLRFFDAVIPGFIFGAVIYKIGLFLDGGLVGVFIPVALVQALLYLVVGVIVAKLRDSLVVGKKKSGALFLTGVILVSLAEVATYFFIRDKVYLSLGIASGALVISVVFLYRKMRDFRADFKRISAKLRWR